MLIFGEENGGCIAELNSNLTPVLLAAGTYWQKGTYISLSDNYTKYRYIIIRQGWNAPGTQPCGVHDNFFVANLNGILNVNIPCYAHGALNNFVTMEFDPANPRQIRISNSNYTKSDSTAVRQVLGVA
ncbi:hypothetical protein [Extibacter muris]|uniref:hypothetical protein n=1 Tax=Extibacter muris TaxID=1796622 RepID=UPI00210E7DA9|nr:hypothetical protein [Extibacter muris]